MGLAGAYRFLTFSMYVGAPLPCTASRRYSYYVLRCCYTLVQQRNLLEQRNPFPPATCGCRSTAKGQMRRLCRGLLPLQRKFRQSSATGAAPDAAARPTPQEHEGDRGEALFCFPPAALRARVDDPSTRESGSQAANRVVPERRRLSKQITIYRVAENPQAGANLRTVPVHCVYTSK